jgi:hypothetical protein
MSANNGRDVDDTSSQNQSLPHPPLPPSATDNSQETTTNSTIDADQVFTPPGSDGGLSTGNGNGQDSSQESQLQQLSQLAAAREKMPDLGTNGAVSRKRMADGMVKQTRDQPSASPGFTAGHSRNTSTVSVASTAGSRVGEVSLICQSILNRKPNFPKSRRPS